MHRLGQRVGGDHPPARSVQFVGLNAVPKAPWVDPEGGLFGCRCQNGIAGLGMNLNARANRIQPLFGDQHGRPTRGVGGLATVGGA